VEGKRIRCGLEVKGADIPIPENGAGKAKFLKAVKNGNETEYVISFQF